MRTSGKSAICLGPKPSVNGAGQVRQKGRGGDLRRPFTWDRAVALLLAAPVGLVLLCLWPIALLCHGRPFLYASRRAGRNGVPFRLWKVRTMHVSKARERVLGGDADDRVTGLGRWLRWSRIDELPQIVNVVRGEMRFVGPRPPLIRYFDAFPDVYGPVLSEPPGITGLATVLFCHREERLLAAAETAEETDAIYRRRCLRQKARLDLLYQGRAGPGLTLMVLILTVWRSPGTHRLLRRLRHRLRLDGPAQRHRGPTLPVAGHRSSRRHPADFTATRGARIETRAPARGSGAGAL